MTEPKFKFDYIRLDLIDISKFNVRTVGPEAGIEELAESIRQIGVQQPVVVIPKGERFELIIGQRRYRAAVKAGLKSIPAVIRTVKNNKEALIASFSENIHRMDLDYQDKMQVAERLLSDLGSTKAVGKAIGVSEQTVRNYLGYSIVPDDIKKMVEKRQMSAQTAIRIARSIPDEKKAVQVAEKVKEIPSHVYRKKVIDLAKEHPDAEPDDIFNMAQTRTFVKVTIDLTPRVAEALEKASSTYQTDPEDIATEALTTWLKERGFLQ